jgi:copper chaperone CopZ
MLAAHPAIGRECAVIAEYVVSGMSCDHCVNSVTSELTRLDGVTNVAVDLGTGRVDVTSERPLALAEVRSAIDEAGYELVDSAVGGAL